jgi:hypothetical protein
VVIEGVDRLRAGSKVEIVDWIFQPSLLADPLPQHC